MTRYRSVLILTVLIGIPLLTGCAEFSRQQPSAKQEQASDQKAPTGAASGKPGSLQACLDKIPEDATEGQRLLAEQSCLRAHSDLVSVTGGEDSPAGAIGAAGGVSDSLQACLERIPDDATAGQRLLAEQSCVRDEAGR